MVACNLEATVWYALFFSVLEEMQEYCFKESSYVYNINYSTFHTS